MKYFNIKYFICQKIYESHIYMNLTYLKKGDSLPALKGKKKFGRRQG